MKKFDVLKMKMVRKKSINEACVAHWLIEGNLPLITTMIKFWNERVIFTCWMNDMKKFNVIEMKMVTQCNNKDKENEFFFKG